MRRAAEEPTGNTAFILTRPVPPANRKAFYTRPAGISCRPLTTNGSSTLRRRRLLVHRGHWLGDGTQLRGVRSALERCDGTNVRRGANWPEPDRFWRIVDQIKLIFSTLPRQRFGRSLSGRAMAFEARLSSLRLLGTVGEPINPEAWMCYHRIIVKIVSDRRYVVAD